MEVSTTAKTKIYDVLNGSVSPILANVYSRHNVADMTLPAVTVDNFSTVTTEEDGALSGAEFIDNYEITLTVRVHTAYMGDYKDAGGTATEIVDDVITILRENMNLGDQYRLFKVNAEEFDLEFEESATTGAELTIIVNKVERY